jgi:phosphohistidine phosphatase
LAGVARIGTDAQFVTQSRPQPHVDLILWRHADADDAEFDGNDIDRDLTRKGERQAKRVGRWLDQHLGDGTRIWSSPAIRAQRTATALGRPFKVREELHPLAAADDVLALVGWSEQRGLPQRNPLLVIGHQPWIGDVASRLLGCQAGTGMIMRKGAVWWLRARANDATAHATLYATLPPDLAPSH